MPFSLKNLQNLGYCATFVAAMVVAPCGALAQPTVLYTGSDTVQPVAAAALTAFVRSHVGYKPQLNDPGTTLGFKQLCRGQAIISGASRLIQPDELKACTASAIEVIELPVAVDAVVLVVSSKNTWLKDLTLNEVTKLFSPASAGNVTSWKQIRASFPDTPLKTAGVGIKHATFGFFSESIGLKGYFRSDYKDLKDHAETGRFVASDITAIGFVPLGEAKAMDGQIRTVGIDFGAGVVVPGADEVSAGKYDKLSRTVYLYVNKTALAKASADDAAFTQMLVKDMDKFVRFVNLVPLRALQYQENAKRLGTGL